MDLRVGDTRIKAAYKDGKPIKGFAIADDGSLVSYKDTGSVDLRQLWPGAPGGIITINNKEYGKALYFYNHQEALGRQLTQDDSIPDQPLFQPNQDGSRCYVDVPDGACIYNLVVKREGVPVTVSFGNCTATNFYIQQSKTQVSLYESNFPSVGFNIGAQTNLRGVYNGQNIACMNGICAQHISLRGYELHDSIIVSDGGYLQSCTVNYTNYLDIYKGGKVDTINVRSGAQIPKYPNSDYYAYQDTFVFIEGTVGSITIEQSNDINGPVIHLMGTCKIGTINIKAQCSINQTYQQWVQQNRVIDTINIDYPTMINFQQKGTFGSIYANASGTYVILDGGEKTVDLLVVGNGASAYFYGDDQWGYPHIKKLIIKSGGSVDGIDQAKIDQVVYQQDTSTQS